MSVKCELNMSSNATPKTSQKGKRYTDAEKKEVVEFVETYNAENGRGGQSAAAAKFSVSQLTVAGWLKSAGSSAASKKGKSAKGAKAAKAVKGAKVSVKSSGSGFNAKLSTLLALSNEIEQTEKELVKLKAKFKSLKASL